MLRWPSGHPEGWSNSLPRAVLRTVASGRLAADTARHATLAFITIIPEEARTADKG